MIELLASLLIFTASVWAIHFGLKNSPRESLFYMYCQKRDEAEASRLRGDYTREARLRREAEEVHQMMRRLERSRVSDYDNLK